MKLILLVFNQTRRGRLIKQYFDGFMEWETHSSSQLHINHKLTHRFRSEAWGGVPLCSWMNSKQHYVKPSYPWVCELLYNYVKSVDGCWSANHLMDLQRESAEVVSCDHCSSNLSRLLIYIKKTCIVFLLVLVLIINYIANAVIQRALTTPNNIGFQLNY